MKYSYLNLIILYPVLLILSYCKEKDKAPEPTASATISYAPIVSWTKAGQIPLIYAGDTIKYNITATASSDITELNVYKVDAATEVKTLLPGYPKTDFSDKKNITDQVYVPVGATADFKAFYLSIETKEGTPITTKSTYKYTALSELTIQTGLRNAFKGQQFKHIYNYHMSDTIQADGSSMLMSEILTPNKISGIRTDCYYEGLRLVIQNHSNYIRLSSISTLGFDDFNSPDQIKNYYNLLKVQAKYEIDLNVDELALCKLNQDDDTLNHLPTYGIIKIKYLYDDGRQGTDVNASNDYILYDIKIFNPYRFK